MPALLFLGLLAQLLELPPVLLVGTGHRIRIGLPAGHGAREGRVVRRDEPIAGRLLHEHQEKMTWQGRQSLAWNRCSIWQAAIDYPARDIRRYQQHAAFTRTGCV